MIHAFINLRLPKMTLRLVPFIGAIFIALTLTTRAADPQTDFASAKEAYMKQEYASAIKLYEGMIKSGNVSPEVYYNLGNCYYKTGNVAQTILNYERAKKLAPDDEDINFNLKIASLKVVDKMDPVPDIFYKRWVHDIAMLCSTNTWSQIFIASAWLLFIFLTIFVVSRTVGMKKISFVIACFFLATTSVSYFISRKSYTLTFVDQQAVVVSPSVYVKNSPDEKGSDQFIIHEGTKMDVLDEFGDWKKVRIANGSVGWLKQNSIELI